MNIIPNPKKCELTGGEVDVNSLCAVTFDHSIAAEGYVIDIDKNGISIKASDERGAFYAVQTLRQLKHNVKTLPCLHIEDSPQFKFRSFMIDCVRHFFTVVELKKMIEGASIFKFNKFHWHLTDDQGWRIQIDKYPLLTEIGSKRKGSHFGKSRDDTEYSGFYTKDEIREIVAFCAERQIDVIPEIEMPGHTSAMLTAYPQFSCFGGVEIKLGGGIFTDLLCVGNDEAVQFAKDILTEVCELFPYEIIHIGGDEAPKDKWKTCPKCQAKMAELGIKDEDAFQEYFTNNIAEFLKTKEKKTIIWSDAFENGKIDKDVIGQFWIGNKNELINHVNSGGKLIMSSNFHFYLDYPYGQIPVNKILKTQLVFDEITEKENVLGVESPLWAEYIDDFEKLTYLAFPRLAAVSECGWNALEQRDVKTFGERYEAIIGLIESVGITSAPKKMWNIKGFAKLHDMFKFWKNVITFKDVKDVISKSLADNKAIRKSQKEKKNK
ncbi:MAG: beta-N-acetylhexosaminidase [Clostridia bacterium]